MPWWIGDGVNNKEKEKEGNAMDKDQGWTFRTENPENRTFFPFPDRYENSFSVWNLIYFDSKFKIIKVKLWSKNEISEQ